jgi:ABC-2 type transport system ATP-binding protein
MANLLTECELSEGTSINQLSFGQKKKFLITFGLATKCQLLLLDEPTNGLDIPSKSVFRRIVAGSLDDDQLVVISTHQVKDIENLIDTILIIDEGNIILNKPLHEITSQIQCSKMSSVKNVEVLYSEAIPGGFHVISPQTNGSSLFELELLFNAIVSGKQILL